ncbi:MAG: response regulator transcription factor [Ignavibacteria bacterium]|nr:response regulator transcription factor [Ignavibacteria bacterium]
MIRNQKKEKSEKHIPGFKVLSRRETEILKNLANGLNNKLIADKFS